MGNYGVFLLSDTSKLLRSCSVPFLVGPAPVVGCSFTRVVTLADVQTSSVVMAPAPVLAARVIVLRQISSFRLRGHCGSALAVPVSFLMGLPTLAHVTVKTTRDYFYHLLLHAHSFGLIK
jgi:hypothetical protein